MTFIENGLSGFQADYSPVFGTRQIPNLAYIFSGMGRRLPAGF
jgi:hypothetical protein